MAKTRDLEFEYTIPARSEKLSDLRAKVRDAIAEAPLDEKTRRLIVLAVDEAVSDLLQPKGDGELQLRLTLSDSSLHIVVRDTVTDFNDADIADDADPSRRCKLGLRLLRALMDEVCYQYTRGFRNELSMLKFLG